MAKFERNPSGSFPEKTKNKLPDFPLLIYRLLTLNAAHGDTLRSSRPPTQVTLRSSDLKSMVGL